MRPAISIIPTSCASISIPDRASRGTTCGASRWRCKALLDELGLRGWPKTSGSRGMHVNVRIEPRWTFTEVRRAALALSREIERRAPTLATSKWWKEERHGVFLDYNQNAKDRTTCSAYSVRPLPDARVSTPLDWDEVPDCDPADFTVLTMPARFAAIGDPHAGMDERRARSTAARARGARRSGRPGRRALAAALPQDGRRGAARRAVAREAAARKTPRRRCRSSSSRTRRTRRRRWRLERWKQRHPEAAAHLAVDDVLVDSMRGRSSTWTRIRVNLRNVPEEMRPPQETPDPDDDPTREWRRTSQAKRPMSVSRQRSAASAKICGQLVRRHDLELLVRAVARALVGAPAAELRRVTEAVALHVVVGDLDDSSGRSGSHDRSLPWLQRLCPPGMRCAVVVIRGSPPAHSPHGMIVERVLAIGRQELRPARGASRR